MPFNREQLPDTTSYFESEGLVLIGRGKWRSTSCVFHGGTTTMRINLQSGGWICMSCAVHGGDVLSYHMQAHEMEFVEAAKALNCWVDDGKPQVHHKPAPLSPRQALSVLAFESTLAAVAAGNVASGVTMTDEDRNRLMMAANRISVVAEAYQ